MTLVVERRYIREVDSGDRQASTAIQCFERHSDELADRREKNRRIKRFRWNIVRILHRGSPKLACEPPRGLAPRHHMDSRSLVQGDLGRNMGGASEPVDSEATLRRKLRTPQCPVSDHTGAQQGGCVKVVKFGWKFIDIFFVCYRELRVASVVVVAREAGVDAQVLIAPQAESTAPTSPSEPRDSDSRSNVEPRRGLAASQ